MKMHGPAHSAQSLQQSRAQLVPGGVDGRRPRVVIVGAGFAPVAKQQGAYVAEAIQARLAGKAQPPPFRYLDRGLLATVGRKTAVIAFGRLQLKGWFAWWIWGIAHIYFLISLRNRLLVMTQWLWSYVSFERGARLITGLHPLKADHEPARARRRDDDATPPPLAAPSPTPD